MNLFSQAFIYLGAALLIVPIAKRLGLGSVLGYLIAGILIGPFGFHLITDAEDVMHFAEFGVVMMLFLVGLELEPARLWQLRGPIFGLGGAQMALTAAILMAISMILGFPWQQGLAIGLILALSSTAIALQSLAEKGWMTSDAGQKSFAVLLFQDIAVIPMLAIFPLLATAAATPHAEHHSSSLVDHLPGWAHGLVVLGAIVAVIIAGRFLVRPAMRVVARTGLREMFTAAALMLVIGVALLMSMVGLSAALGTFLAGVVLANSEYRHELESDVEPFKGLLLGLFFLAVGASIDFGLVIQAPVQMAGLVVGITIVKLIVLFGLGRLFKTKSEQNATFAVALSQIGEFAFVLLIFTSQSGILPDVTVRPLMAVTALSMAVSPLLLAFHEKFILPRLSQTPTSSKESDVEDEEHPVIIAGYGRFGQIAGRFLRANGIGATVLDIDSDQVDILRKFGQKVYYGDGSRLDLLRAAGAAKAKVLIIAVDIHEKAMDILHTTRKHFPHLQILVRARGRSEAYELIDLEADGIYRETYDTSLRVGIDAMTKLGVHPHQATRAARIFRRHDEASLRELARVRHDTHQLQKTARERIAILEDILASDQENTVGFQDHGWDSEPLRQGVNRSPESDLQSEHR